MLMMLVNAVLPPAVIAASYWAGSHLQIILKEIDLDKMFQPGWQHQAFMFVHQLLSRLVG